MTARPSSAPLGRHSLARAEHRLSYLYAEHCVVHRDANAVTLTDQRGVVHVPAASLAALLLGPGTRTTFGAMSLLGDCGVSVVWVGERGVRYYAHGRSLSASSRLAEAQAAIVTNQRRRLECARAMYSMRFPGEDVSGRTMAELRGREGARMKKIYREHAERTGVEWSSRRYDPDDFSASDAINQALTSCNAALYGVTQAVLVSLGAVPALGVVHSGTDRAFVYDIADLFKAEVVVPAAFDVAAAGEDDAGPRARRALRDQVVETRLIPRMIAAVHELLDVPDEMDLALGDLLLWDELDAVAAGKNWSGTSS
ncbi:type I-E CRISPR-associated endonuclease Cas1e [Helcobacillus sp. ACRRO]|nr:MULTISPECIES: type I-E CRISPR-associated endonuclease Cas1e [Helcobacillus]MCG7427937.1 type I-E CRISPR-associated endonuclease Cas1e [Helcobacillus sp. ACRRO]MDK7741644.1 type I-E CRISPR-associated endonuclease Cas1e [Helcobacillus massiliensis]